MADFTEVMAFVGAVDAGSFAAAGRARGLTRSAIAKAITRLELRLNVRLIHRTTRSFSLTDEGRRYYDRCCQILADLEDAEASLGQTTLAPRGVLRLTVPDAFGRRCALPAVYDFLKTWPAVEVEISFTDRIADIVEDGFDLALRVGGNQVETHLISRTVAQYRSVICASPSYVEKHGEPHRLEDLASHDCLIFSSLGQQQTWSFRVDREWVEVSTRSRMRLDSAEAICHAASAGMGIAYLPSFLVDDELEQGTLVPLLPDFETRPIPICAIYSNKRHLSPRVRVFIDTLVRRWQQ